MSRRNSAHCSTSSTPPPGLYQHDQATLTITPDASIQHPRGVKSQPAEGGQFLTGADIFKCWGEGAGAGPVNPGPRSARTTPLSRFV